MIKIKDLNKAFEDKNAEKVVIYKNLNLEVKSGEFISILGTSGSGKTTLLNIISGLDTFNSGSVIVNGYNLGALNLEERTSYRGKNTAIVFQQFNLIENLTIKDNIDLIVELNELKRRFKTEDILKIVGLEKKLNSYPYNLSGGEQQRVAIARAFVLQSPILLIDEATGNLDEENTRVVIGMIEKLHKETQNTVVMITHDKDIAKMADRIYYLKDCGLVGK